MNWDESIQYLRKKKTLHSGVLVPQRNCNDCISLKQLVSVEVNFWLSSLCTAFKPSVGSHYSSACSYSIHLFEQTICITAKHTHPIHWPLASLHIGFQLSLSSFIFPFVCLSFFPRHRLGIKSPFKSISCAKSAYASFSALAKEGERCWGRILYQGTPNS